MWDGGLCASPAAPSRFHPKVKKPTFVGFLSSGAPEWPKFRNFVGKRCLMKSQPLQAVADPYRRFTQAQFVVPRRAESPAHYFVLIPTSRTLSVRYSKEEAGQARLSLLPLRKW